MDNHPTLSVLVPSRGRADALKFSLDSLGLDENNLEALIWVDEDDPQLKTYQELFGSNNHTRLYIKPRVGYRNFHIMLNFLAANSSSDWLFLWNDDAYMDTTKWYDTFAEHACLVNPEHDPIVFDIWSQGSNDNSFPIISRKYFELLGYFAPTAYSNLYVKYVANNTKIHRTIFGIKPNHRNYGRDKKMGDIFDDTKKDIDALKQKSKWMGLLTGSMWHKKQEDVATVLKFVKKRHAGFIGLGKLGLPVALAMEARGNRIVGYDVNPKIRNSLKEKKVPFQEDRVQELLNVTQLEILDSVEEVVKKTDLIFYADPDNSHIKKAIKEIVAAAEKLNKKITLVVISTCLPGTYERKIKPLLTPNINYIYNPYFIAMGTVINDFYNPDFILIGKDEGDVTPLTNFYKLTLGDKKMVITDIPAAEKMNKASMDFHPVLSVLVPSRERASALKFSLTSLGLKRNNIEVLVWIDDDDPQLSQYRKLFDKNSHVRLFIKPKVGYIKFHVMLNYLATQASGDWLWLWNDDAYMEKADWYNTFISHASLSKPKEEPIVYNLSPGKNGFPIVSRKYLEILGHFAGSTCCDLCIRRVAQGADIQRYIPGIEPTHRKYGCDTKLGDLRDATYNSVESLRRYFGGTTRGDRNIQKDDTAKIVNWINENISNRPLLSVFVPSRGRAEILKFSLDSLGLDENNLEVLTWIDEDDPQLKTYHQLFDNNKKIKMFVKPRVGYKNYHIMANFLASQSTGDWIFLWNDDAYMDNPDWYKTFIEYSSLVDPQEEPIALNIWGQGASYNAFPIISRKFYKIVGHFTATASCDRWIERVAHNTRVQRTIFGIKPKHRKYGYDEKFGNLEDQTKIDIDLIRQKSKFLGFFTGGTSRMINEDRQKLLDFTKKRHAGFIGLGKLGLPVALAMEARGNRIAGYDVNPKIRNYLKEKKVPFQEEQVQGLLGDAQLEILDSIEEVVKKTDLIFCAVQTPHGPKFAGDKPLPKRKADFDYSYLKKAIKEIVSAAEKLNKKITLVVISTCLPGTYKREIKPLLTPNVNYIYNPYFIAMGTVINDFYNPEFILIGKDEGDVTPLTNFYKLTLGQQKVFITDITTAEGIKMFYNTFITSKIVFANTYGEMAHKLGMNADDMYQAFSLSTNRINSPKYLKPGVGDGGACHIRDNIAMSHLAKKTGLSFNYFDWALEAREKHTQWLADLFIGEITKNKIPGIILGKSFKPETDLQTGSPAILLANILKGKKIDFQHYEFDYPEQLPVGVYFIATQHPAYQTLTYSIGSVIIDPFRYINPQSGVKIIGIGRP